MHASTIFVAILAAVSASVSGARPVYRRDDNAFGVDVKCLGFNYLFGGPHHTPNAARSMDMDVAARDHAEDGAGFSIDLPGFGSLLGGKSE
ncbi:hypothetical protein C8F01DRAFT_1262368 [Mycena amicta]|nr:hypothetical protein C8F01DRAFT_1262368 [Mycena amicta]